MIGLMNETTDSRTGSIPVEGKNHEDAELGDTRQFVSFAIGKSAFAVDIMSVREIRAWTGTTSLPNSAPYVRGVINLRGDIIPIIDTRQRFGEGETVPDSSHVVIVVSVGGKLNGLLVDRVSDIINVAEDEILAVPQLDAAVKQRFLAGLVTIEEEMIAVIDLAEITN